MKRISIIFMLACSMVAVAQPVYTLQQLTDSALLHSAALRNAGYDVEAARQQRKEAFTKYFPNVSATGVWFNTSEDLIQLEANPSDYIPSDLVAGLAATLPPTALASLAQLGNPISVSMLKEGVLGGITAVQPVFAGGQIVNGNRLARVGEEAAELQARLSENEVRRTVAAYYYQLLSLRQKLSTLDAVDTMLADIEKDVSVSVHAGVAMQNDLLQVQLRQNEMASQRVKVQNGVAVVRLLTAHLCGLPSTEFDVADEHVSGASMSLSEADLTLQPQEPSQAVANTPEYQLLRLQADAAELRRRMEVGSLLPTVGVGASYSYNNLLDRDRGIGMVFAAASVPLSGWWGGSHAIRRKAIERDKALSQLDDQTEMLKIRIEKAYNDLAEAAQQVAIAQRGIAQAEENLRLNRSYYHAGTSSMSDLLQAQLLHQQALDRHTDALADYHNRLIEYRQACGE